MKENLSFGFAADFLLYSYFELTPHSTSDEVLKKAISRAYRDATQQGAYNTLISKGMQSASRTAHQSGCAKLQTEITAYFSESVDKAYDTWHNELCRALLEIYCAIRCYSKQRQRTEPAFTYGNAQKWLNMTVKYLYLLHDMSQTQSEHSGKFTAPFDARIAALAPCFHVPVDRYILESVWSDEKSCIALPLKEGALCKNGTRGAYSSEKIVPWSQWDEDTYTRFQHDLCKVVEFPIEWECTAWIEAVQREKKA